jgi:group II intron reverse transcriptase/maturase
VFDAWKCVKANRGGAGIDAQSIAEFEENLANNLYALWNRMASGSYLPSPVKEVPIPKRNGGIRFLGVPTVADRVAQTVVKSYLEPKLDPLFDEDSYGYRPGRSAKDAIRVTRERCWKFNWVLEFDVKGAFDALDHGLIMKALRKHTDCKWALLYVERWLTAPSMDEAGKISNRDRGTPQGGVISPLLMNLFMHYAFDRWIRREIPNCRFARYADDAVVHCLNEQMAQMVKQRLAERFAACGLTLHPEKTRIVYCRDTKRRADYPVRQFTFLGFTFRPRSTLARDGRIFVGFQPAVSREALTQMRQRIRSWHLPRQTSQELSDFSAKYDAVLRGWWNYYGSFLPSAMAPVFRHFDAALAYWARRKYRRLSKKMRRSQHWLLQVAQREPYRFIHWRHRVAKPGHWEPCEARVSRTVLRAAAR